MATTQRFQGGNSYCDYNGFRWIIFIFVILATTAASQKSPVADRCPSDYRYRVEMCIMEAQVAPQAGGGLSLITQKDKLQELCTRGILQKSIDCLRDIYARCSHNATHRHELDMLFSISDWRIGRDLLCEDLNMFKDHFECVSKFGNRISSCILIRTQLFRQAITQAGEAAHKTLHDITCNFAENIVGCLERPLMKACPIKVVEVMTSALHRFLPPACAPVPAVNGYAEYDGEHEDSEEMAEEYDDEEEEEPITYETVIVEGGDADN